MTDISTFHTQRAGGPLGTPEGQGAALSPVSGLGNFLDLLLASVLTGEQKNIQVDTPLTKEPSATPDPIYTSVADVLEQKPEESLLSALPTPSLLSSALILPVQQPVVEPVQISVTSNTSELADGAPSVVPGISSIPALPNGSFTPEESSSTATVPVSLTSTPEIAPDSSLTATDAPEQTFASSVLKPQMESSKTSPPSILETPEDLTPTPELAAKLNALSVGGPHKQQQQSGSRPMPFFQEGLMDDGSAPLPAGYPGILSGGERGYAPVLHTDKAPTLTASLPQPKPDNGDALVTLDLSALSPDGLTGLANASAHVSANAVKHSEAAQKTSPLSTVALHLTQMAQSQETRSMTVQLNPPELGRIQVKLNYGRDKTVKADIAVEKSDTLSLLQKDSDVLRQALTDAGLQADAGALNFSLAHDGTFMGDTGNGGEGNVPNTAGGEAIGDDLAVFDIKTREVWTVDPKTGDVHYDILT